MLVGTTIHIMRRIMMTIYYNKRTKTWIGTCVYLGVDISVSAHFRVDMECELYHSQMLVAKDQGEDHAL